jgi:DnaJ-class molecular chaperone
MADGISRRVFIAASSMPLLVSGHVVLDLRRACSPGSTASVNRDDQEMFVGPHQTEECTECRGLGSITCPACDGTGLWTEASEAAGLHSREFARVHGHCARCSASGESACPVCEGSGFWFELNQD